MCEDSEPKLVPRDVLYDQLTRQTDITLTLASNQDARAQIIGVSLTILVTLIVGILTAVPVVVKKVGSVSCKWEALSAIALLVVAQLSSFGAAWPREVLFLRPGWFARALRLPRSACETSISDFTKILETIDQATTGTFANLVNSNEQRSRLLRVSLGATILAISLFAYIGARVLLA